MSGEPAREPTPRRERHEPDAEGDRAGRGFPLLGIGASAGGLEALEQLLKSLPARSGPASVVVGT